MPSGHFNRRYIHILQVGILVPHQVLGGILLYLLRVMNNIQAGHNNKRHQDNPAIPGSGEHGSHIRDGLSHTHIKGIIDARRKAHDGAHGDHGCTCDGIIAHCLGHCNPNRHKHQNLHRHSHGEAAYGKDRNEDGDEQLFFSRKHLAQLGTKGGDHPCLHNQLKGAADDENKEDDLVYAGAAQSSHKSHGDFQR